MNTDINRLYSPKALLKLSAKLVHCLLDESAKSFSADFPNADKLPIRELEPYLLPVVSAVKSVGPVAQSTFEIVEAIKSSCDLHRWRQPYLEKDLGATFTKGSAWFALADVDGPIVYTEGLVEIMLLNSGVVYPKHSHSPEELYIVLAGQVWWEADDADDSSIWKSAGEVIHHLPHQAHAITAGENPVLILNLWRGGSFEMPIIK